ncbi:hypothetical protein V1J52_25290 [Streptomyces sp. TRM 70351]|uniref:hypothetical protein n=1 Tax=Streptomyces sp. TRM 70351 TaxID=3116552 RepID=UPI002E7C39B5|nr:hypothetical protein [Streptomyces sp. TRM 70351]MEE1931439.1 hypothetical protein [Streptomyces sp. TRM 70351]
MSDLVPRTAGVLAKTGQVIADGVRYGVVITQLTAASVTMRGLSEQVRATYTYVEDCAASVDRLADQAASMNVDKDTVGEHRDAATVMRSVLEEAEAMATECEEMSTLFHETAEAHIADYGAVADAVNNMPVEMADREFYSNR